MKRCPLLLCLFALAGSHADASTKDAFQHLNLALNRYHKTVDVFTDRDAAGNHFTVRCLMFGGGASTGDVAFDESWSDGCRSGSTCIASSFAPSIPTGWAGVYFQNGVLGPADREPRCHWGTEPDAGLDLTGQVQLSFWARGAEGGERIEFFVGGVGHTPGSSSPFADSLERVPKLGRITRLSRRWRRYRIQLRRRDLRYVNGGFGWTALTEKNPEGATFFLDDIQFRARSQALRLLTSYETLPASTDEFDATHRDVAFTYDNAVALIAYLSRGRRADKQKARLLADALVYAQEHDRFYDDGRLRNAYRAGDLASPPGWTVNGRVGTARLPGWWDSGTWVESADHVGTSTGNMAWVMLALLRAYDVLEEPAYLDAATRLGRWVIDNTYDASGGFTGGFEGWEPAPTNVSWKSTEHNLGVYVAFMTLHDHLGADPEWHDHAIHAKAFVRSMWRACGNARFATGTWADGVTPNCDFAPTDVNTLGLMAVGEVETYGAGVDWVTANAGVEELCGSGRRNATGVDFNDDRDGIWWEGTAHTVLALQTIGERKRAMQFLRELRRVQNKAPNKNRRGIVATCHDGVSTGIAGFEYLNRLHVGATAWYALAELGVNPFWGVRTRDAVPHEGE